MLRYVPDSQWRYSESFVLIFCDLKKPQLLSCWQLFLQMLSRQIISPKRQCGWRQKVPLQKKNLLNLFHAHLCHTYCSTNQTEKSAPAWQLHVTWRSWWYEGNCESTEFFTNSPIYNNTFGDLSELVYIVKIDLDSFDIWCIWEINTGQYVLIMHCQLVLTE